MKLLSAILFLVVLFQGVVPQAASMQGVVLEAGTGKPLSGATVQLRGDGRSPLVLARDTRSDGTFEFRNIPPGTYEIEAKRAGYIPEVYGDRPEKSILPKHTIQSGQVLSGISISLMPGAVIYGRLVDDRGEVVAGAVVEALKTTYREGQRERSSVQAVLTNDLGEYRLFMLPPGEYSVRAALGSNGFRPDTLEVVPVYFPGTIDPKESRSIELRTGETVGGIDFVSFPVRTRRVSGRVLNTAGEPGTVLLSPRNSSAAMEKTIDPVSGIFEFANVIPGPYILVAKSSSRKSVRQLDVGNADLPGIPLTLDSGSQIPTQVHIEGHPGGDDPELEKLYFAVTPNFQLPGNEVYTYSPFANGRFTLDLVPGNYRIDIARSNDFYVKAMTLGATDVLISGLEVSGSSAGPLEILVGTKPGAVEGRTTKPGVTVVLAPDGARRVQRTLYRSVKSGPSGEFHFTKVPPGDYKLFAWQAENGGPWLDPEYLETYESRGISIRIEQGHTLTLNTALQFLD